MSGWSSEPPAREELVLNILGTRAMLPTDPDYDIVLLPAFVKEACGTRGFRGYVPLEAFLYTIDKFASLVACHERTSDV